MTEVQFFRNFAKHIKLAKKIGIWEKKNVIVELSQGHCPLHCNSCSMSRGESGCEAECDPLHNLETYTSNSEFYEERRNGLLADAMIKLVKEYW